jgi:hypothetical protein
MTQTTPAPWRRRGVIQLHDEILGQLLPLPQGQRIIGFHTDLLRLSINVLIEGDGLPECAPGCEPCAVNGEPYWSRASRWALRGRDLEDRVRALLDHPDAAGNPLADHLRVVLDGDDPEDTE